jgi:negative regulator of replication initiation
MKKILIEVSDEFYDYITSNSTSIQAEGCTAENIILNGTVINDKNVNIVYEDGGLTYEKN